MKRKKLLTIIIVLAFGCFLTAIFFARPTFENKVSAETFAVNFADDEFDQAAALAKLRESIKGREQEPAEKVFKNIQIFKGRPAAQVLGIMQSGFTRAINANCTYCHTPEDWSNDDKEKKQVAREMWDMTQNINNQSLKAIKNISEKATINCMTCHRGQKTPAINMPPPSPVPTIQPK